MTHKTFTTPVDCRKAAHIAVYIVNRLDNVQSVLDIGCGDAVVDDNLDAAILYRGFDLGSLDDPASNNQKVTYFKHKDEVLEGIGDENDAILLLDVLEHTDDFTELFDESCKKAKKFVVVSLPNEFSLFSRFRFLMGSGFEMQDLTNVGKPKGYRHLWVIDPEIARTILTARGHEFGFVLKDEYDWKLTPNNLIKRLAYMFLTLLIPKTAWSFHSVFVFERT